MVFSKRACTWFVGVCVLSSSDYGTRPLPVRFLFVGSPKEREANICAFQPDER